MKQLIDLFRVKPEERLPALVMTVFLLAITAVFISAYYWSFSIYNVKGWEPFYKYFRVSGYDSFIYSIVSHWRTFYTIVFRHPLLCFLFLPLYGLNYGLYLVTGLNLVQFVVAAVLLFCAFYAFLFLYRTFRHAMDLGRKESTLLAFMTFSFAHVMVTVIVPDHFIISLFFLSLTLYVSGMLMKRETKGLVMTARQTFFLIFLTAGVTLTNGVKTALAALFVNRRAFFNPKYLFGGILLPFLLLTVISFVTYQTLTRPDEIAREKLRIMKQKMKREAPAPPKKKVCEPISEKGFLKWSDITTSRSKSIYHNLFGESIQFHQKDLLRDSQYGRELFARYDYMHNYLVEAVIVLLFMAGIWCGRRSKLLWLCLSWFAFDMTMHLGFGFALREVYLMSAHWIFAIPLAIGFIFRRGGKTAKAAYLLTAALTIYLYLHNTTLLVGYFIT